MLRNSLIVIGILVVSMAAFGTVISDQTVTINLTVAVYTECTWQETAIQFRDLSYAGPDYDWWNTTGHQGTAYNAPPDPATPTGKYHASDPWAGDPFYCPTGEWWESFDGAHVFVRSNCGLTMDVVPGGPLSASCVGCPTHTLETWYTVAATGMNWDTPPSHPNGGFMANGCVYGMGNIPLIAANCDGQYLGNSFNLVATPPAPPADNMWPGQWDFPMTVGSNQQLGMDCIVCGTFEFKARVLRQGMVDPAGAYTTNLQVTISQP